MNTALPNQEKFIKEAFSRDVVTIVENDSVSGTDDWRNIAVNKGLKISDSEWVCFWEQDFSINDSFWPEIRDLMSRTEVFGWYEDTRLHPCCTFIKRELLDKTHKNFGVLSGEFDHFGQLQRDLENKKVIIGVIPRRCASHMNGLSQNIYLLQTGQVPNFRPDEFKDYCRRCLELPMPSDLKNLMETYIL